VLFDLDGTLVDSEPLVGRSVQELLRDEGIEARPPIRLAGRGWTSIAAELTERHPALAGSSSIADALEARFRQLWETAPPLLIPGAREALESAALHLATAVVTSARRRSVDVVFATGALGPRPRVVVSAEDVQRFKPDPQCFLLAAWRLGVVPSACLVFEDSVPGLTAARAAGMRVVAVIHRAPDVRRAEALSDRSVPDFLALPDRFFERIARPGGQS
jgi:sugar-phosphatase